MRAFNRIIIVSLFLCILPTAVADDPNLTLPEADTPATASSVAAGAQVGMTTGFTRAAFYEGSQAANEAQQLTLPASRAGNVLFAAGDFGAASIGNARTFAVAAIIWSGDQTWTKVDEVQAFLVAADQASASGVAATEAIVGAIASVLCSQPVDPTACEDGSLVGAVEYEVDRLLGRGGEEAQSAPASTFAETRAAAVRLVETVVPLP